MEGNVNEEQGGMHAERISQGFQEARLERIFRALHIDDGPHRHCVELGFPAVEGSNTEALRRRGWQASRFDGRCTGSAASDAQARCHRGWIRSSNVVDLFRSHAVPPRVYYVSIDLDTIDLWVLRSLIGSNGAASRYRPKVFSVEYNSNFPWGYSLAFPDTSHPGVESRHRRWDNDCYMGSSASAIHAVAREHGYVLVDVEPGLDVFLVDEQLWADRPVPVPTTAAVYRPFNIQKRHVGLSAAKASNYVEYETWRAGGDAGGGLQRARARAQELFAQLRAERLPI